MSKLGQLWKSKPSRSLKENSLQHFANWQERLHPRQPKGDMGGQFRKKPLPVHTNYLRMDALKKVGPQMGSNPGGVFADKAGKHYYIKKGRSSQHVRNELASAALYKLAGGTVPSYVQVEGGQHVATEMLPLKKNSIADFTSEERQRVKDDFMIHAWLANWDAIGLGGDNQGIANGTPVTLDVGGSMLFRAQGGEKPSFGDDVPEVVTLRDAKYNRDAAKAFSGMSMNELRASAKKVTGVADESIRKVISRYDLPEALADKLIARKHYIAGKFGGERITEQVRQFKKFLREDYEYKGTVYKEIPDTIGPGETITVVSPHYDEENVGKKYIKRSPDKYDWEEVKPDEKPAPMDLQAKLAQANAAAEKPAEPEKPKTGYEYEGKHLEQLPYSTLPVGAVVTSLESGKKFAKNEPGYNSWAEVPPKPPGVVSDGYLYKGKFYWKLPVDKIPIGDTVLNVTSKKKFVRYAQGGLGWESSWKEWDEKDHPRVGKGSPKGGQFTFKNKKPVVKKDSQKQNPYGGMYVTTGESPLSNHWATFYSVMKKPVKIGIHYRRLLAKLIEDFPKYDTPPENFKPVNFEVPSQEAAIEQLKQKLIDSLMKTRDKLLNNGKGIAAQKIEAQLKKLGYDSNTKQSTPAEPTEPTVSNKTDLLKSAKEKIWGVVAMYPQMEKSNQIEIIKSKLSTQERDAIYGMISGYIEDAPAGINSPSDLEKSFSVKEIKKYAPKFYKEYDAWLNSGKVGDALQDAIKEIKMGVQTDGNYKAVRSMLSYSEIKAIEKHYGSLSAAYDHFVQQALLGNEITKMMWAEDKKKLAPLKDKNDVDLQDKLVQANAAAGKKDDESLTATAAKVLEYKKNEEEAEKNKAQEEANKKLAAEKKKKEEAEALAQQKQVMKELGIDETEAGAFMGLVKMEYGGYNANEQLKNAIYTFKQQKKDVEQLGIKEMTGFQAALIRNYTDGGYGSVNSALRTGHWTPEQHLYVQQVNKAIGALPKYSGVVQRGTSLDSDQQALYKKGYIVEERALTSTGIKTDFGGNTKYYITATGKRAAHIKQLSNHPGENEVLFKSHTFFHVDDVKNKGNGNIEVYMTEIE